MLSIGGKTRFGFISKPVSDFGEDGLNIGQGRELHPGRPRLKLDAGSPI